MPHDNEREVVDDDGDDDDENDEEEGEEDCTYKKLTATGVAMFNLWGSLEIGESALNLELFINFSIIYLFIHQFVYSSAYLFFNLKGSLEP